MLPPAYAGSVAIVTDVRTTLCPPYMKGMKSLLRREPRLAAAASNDELDQALDLLEELTSSARHRRWNGLLIETLLLQAEAKLRRVGPQEGLSAMDEAVRLAHRGGFFQTIVEEEPRAADLLRAGLDAGKWTDPACHPR